jgi:environmental stress-induced protein Ves
MLVDGQGMDLAVGTDAPHRLDRPFEPFVFSGDVPAECRLIEGPVRDFNLMVDRSQLQSRMQVWRALSTEQSIDLVSADHVVHCFAGAADLACASARWSRRLQANETAVFRRSDSARASLQVAPVAGASPTLALIALAAPAGG